MRPPARGRADVAGPRPASQFTPGAKVAAPGPGQGSGAGPWRHGGGARRGQLGGQGGVALDLPPLGSRYCLAHEPGRALAPPSAVRRPGQRPSHPKPRGPRRDQPREQGAGEAQRAAPRVRGSHCWTIYHERSCYFLKCCWFGVPLPAFFRQLGSPALRQLGSGSPALRQLGSGSPALRQLGARARSTRASKA